MDPQTPSEVRPLGGPKTYSQELWWILEVFQPLMFRGRSLIFPGVVINGGIHSLNPYFLADVVALRENLPFNSNDFSRIQGGPLPVLSEVMALISSVFSPQLRIL